MKNIECSKNLREFALVGIRLAADTWETLATHLKQTQTLKKLTLNACCFSHKTFDIVV